MMKINTTFLPGRALLHVFFALCAISISAQQTDDPLDEIPPDRRVTTRHKGIPPDTVLINKLLFSGKIETWDQYDHYYRHTIPAYHANQDYTENLKKITVSMLVQNTPFLKKGNKEDVAFYTRELLSFTLVDADVLVPAFKSLEGYWPQAEIKCLALEAYDTLIAYVKTKMKNPDEMMAQYGEKYQRLKAYGESIVVK